MAEKKSFVLRLSPEMYAAIEKWAADDFRSVNGQLEWLLDSALKNAGRKIKSNSSTVGLAKEKKDI
jgi:hypothetical protein